MESNAQDFEAFAAEYQKEEKEVLVLISDDTGGAGKCGNSWDASRYFLIFVDIASNKLKKAKRESNGLFRMKNSKNTVSIGRTILRAAVFIG